MEDHEVGRRHEPVQRDDPARLETARDLARDSGPGIAIGEHDIAPGEWPADLVRHPVGSLGRREQGGDPAA